MRVSKLVLFASIDSTPRLGIYLLAHHGEGVKKKGG